MIQRLIFSLFILALPFDMIAQDKIIIDLKVPLMESVDLAAAQAGATVYLMQSDWAMVSDVGEDIAVWMTGYERHINILRQQVISLTLEIREPAMLRTGNLIQQEKVIVRYWPDRSDTEKYKQQILNELNDISNELKVEAYHLGVKIESQLESILR